MVVWGLIPLRHTQLPLREPRQEAGRWEKENDLWRHCTWKRRVNTLKARSEGVQMPEKTEHTVWGRKGQNREKKVRGENEIKNCQGNSRRKECVVETEVNVKDQDIYRLWILIILAGIWSKYYYFFNTYSISRVQILGYVLWTKLVTEKTERFVFWLLVIKDNEEVTKLFFFFRTWKSGFDST